ncbi:MAG TPA: hypothetical protein PK006_03945 [Saprospiraceae bacterium]|nr:hypothetical protein [Saprospiraceae bacterium]
MTRQKLAGRSITEFALLRLPAPLAHPDQVLHAPQAVIIETVFFIY